MSQQRLLKDNIALVAGISLPVLLVIVFWIATVIPQMTVPDPQYDLVYSADHYDYNTPLAGTVSLDVREGRLHATFHRVEGQRYSNTPRVYYFDVAAGSLQELTIEVPEGLQDGQKLDIPEASGLLLSKKSIAPDGYAFDGNYSSYRGLFFFDGGYRYQGLIRKEGRAIKIPAPGYRHQGELRFLGWVLETGTP
jgi:hypothetical protein